MSSAATKFLSAPDVPGPLPGHLYRPDIDGLRALAIISVVGFHAGLSFVRGGFVGVDVFFVISGYLIGILVYRDIRASRFSFVHFYKRRAKRILPALITVLIACSLIAFCLLSPLELRDYSAQSFATVTSSSNLYYWQRANYFNPVSAFKPLLMTWSLGIEEQFYLLFPLSLFLASKFAKRHVFPIVAAGCALSFTACVVAARLYPSAAFYLLPTRAWELGLGVLIAVYELERRAGNSAGAARGALGWLGLALTLAPMVIYTESTPFPGLAALPPTVGTACLIMAPGSFVNRRLLASRQAVFVGLISYSWYLWHWPMLSFARIVSGGMLSAPRAVSIAILSLALALVSHRWIEQPFRRLPTRGPRLWAGLGALGFLAAVAFAGFLKAGWPARMPELAKLEAAVSDVEANPCLATFDESRPRLRAPCIVDGSPKAALLGDSHAAALGPAMRQLALRHGYGFELLAKASCAPLKGASLRWTLRPTFERECADFNRSVAERVLSEPNTTVVILAGFWSGPLEDNSTQSYSDPAKPVRFISQAESFRNFHAGLVEAISVFRRSGRRVLVAIDVPRFDPDPMVVVRNSMIKRRGELAWLLSPRAASFSSMAEENVFTPADARVEREVREGAAEGGAEILDLPKSLCMDSPCRFFKDGVLLYADRSHLTAAGAEYALRGEDAIFAKN